MTKEINTDGWELLQENLRPYFAMSDDLVLFPNTKTSTTVWDMTDGRSVGVLEGHSDNVVGGALNAAGSVAMTMGRDNAILPYAVKIWSLDTLQCTADMTSTSDTSCLLKDRVLLGSDDGIVKVWDIGGSAPVALMDLEGHDHAVYSITASDTSNVALSGSRDTSVRLWDLRTGRIVRVMSEEHIGFIRSVSMDSACRTAVSGSDDVMLWDLGSGRCINNYDVSSNVHHVMMHKSGSSFLTSYNEVFFKAWSTVSEYEDPIIDADLSSLCDLCIYDPSIAASRDLSRVGMCCVNKAGDNKSGLLVSVWK